MSCHQVNDYRLISFCMSYPTLKSYDIIRAAVAINRLNRGLFLNSVKVFVKAINKKRKKLLRIMLSVTREHRIDCTNSIFNIVRRKCAAWVTPHRFYELGIRFSKFSFTPKRINSVYLFLKTTTQKILSKRNCIW